MTHDRSDKFTTDWGKMEWTTPSPGPLSSADPRHPKRRRLLIKSIFNGNEALYDEFLAMYDAAVERGSAIPYDVAMIEFRKRYIEVPGGNWVKRPE